MIETPTCVLRIMPDTLSAYRSHLMADEDYAQLTAHIATCSVCAGTLHDYDRLAQKLRHATPIAPGNDLWRDVHARISAQHATPIFTRQRIAWGSTGAIAVVLVAALLFSGIVRPPTAKLTPTATAGVNPYTIRPEQGWVFAKELANMRYLAQASGDSQVLYAYGLSPDRQAIAITASHDGGRTWQPLPQVSVNAANAAIANEGGADAHFVPQMSHSTALGAYYLIVSPARATDVVLGYDLLIAGHTSTRLMRSSNGGHSWIPLIAEGIDPSLDYAQPLWAGSTLFMFYFRLGSPGTYGIASSVDNSGPIAVDQNAAFPRDLDLYGAFALGKTLYVYLSAENCQTEHGCVIVDPQRRVLFSTTDEGQSWHQQSAASAPNEFLSMVDSQTLVGKTDSQYFISHDHGQTWESLPPVPIDNDFEFPSYLATGGFASTPDGTLYLFEMVNQGQTQGEQRMVMLVPGRKAWQVVPDSNGAAYVTWDTKGHPVAYWRYADILEIGRNVDPGLAFHSAK